ncbi:ABC transporter substrate-binding protein [Chloroflexota bacterium]
MVKKILWLFISCLMALSLIIASCGQAADGEEEGLAASSKPVYGGTLRLATANDILNFDPMDWVGGGPSLDLTMNRLWDGDWAKGKAGGYGTGETDWATSYDVRSHKRGYIAEDITFEVDNEKNIGRIVYKIREGVKWAKNPDSAAAVITNGRAITADDVVFSLNRCITEPKANIYRSNPALREAIITKTGPMEVTVEVPVERLLEAGKRFGDSTFPVPKDAIEQLGDIRDWENAVGTGPFVLTDYVLGSTVTLKKNPDYWLKDPVGPGKGNDLPYLDEVKWLIIPDLSTRLAALRTGEIDQYYDIHFEDADILEETAPGLIKAVQDTVHVFPAYMRTDKEPYSNKDVRRAMMMAIDQETIERDLYNDTGRLVTWPYYYSKAYENLYLGLDDPEMPDSVKELFEYKPEKAKELLDEAGYPDGFKTELICNASQADYYSIIKEYWDAVGINLDLKVVEAGALRSVQTGRSHEHMVCSSTGPPSIWPMLIVLTGEGWQNTSLLDDPIVNEAAAEIGRLAITDEMGAMAKTKELMKYVQDQAWVIQNPDYPRYVMYWPWIKNYSGERSIGYFWVHSWPQFVWIDEDMKSNMGH